MDRLERWQEASADPERSTYFSQLEDGEVVDVGHGVRVVPDTPDSSGCARGYVEVDGVSSSTIRDALGIFPESSVSGIQAVDHGIAIRNLILGAKRILALLQNT